MRRGAILQPVRFAATGIVNTALDIAVFGALTIVFGWAPAWANLVSYSVGHVNSFLLNRCWTFKATHVVDRGSTNRGWGPQFARFTAVNGMALALNTGTVWALTPSLGPMPAKLVATLVSFVWGYLLSRRWVFS
jgi:putative flippase GtrA